MDDQNNQNPGDITNTFTLNLSDIQVQGADGFRSDQTIAYQTQAAGSSAAVTIDPFAQPRTAPSETNRNSDPSWNNGEESVGVETTLSHAFHPDFAMQLPSTGALPDGDSYVPTEITFTTAVATNDQQEKIKKVVTKLALASSLAFLGFIGFLYMDATSNGLDPVNHIMATLGLGGPEVVEIQRVARTPQRKVKNVTPSNTSLDERTMRGEAGIVPGNPYWDLPNPQPKRTDPDARYWSTEERIIWKGGMTHRYNYQHYKTLKEVRSYQLKGSEEILWKGLKEPKLWSRMSAAMGLAEIGVPVDVDLVEQAIGNGRPELVVNYFKRFKRHRTAGELFVLRQAIKVVNAPARLVILEALAAVNDGLRDVYLVAGTFDPGRGIASFAKSQLARLKIATMRMESLRNFILGTEELPEDLKAKIAGINPEGNEVQKVEEINTVEKIEFYGGVRSESISNEGMIDDEQSSGFIEIKGEDLM